MTGSDFYTYVLQTFKRTDKSTEVYNAINDSIDHLIQRYPFDDFKTAQDSSSIASLGDHSYSLPADFNNIIGEIVLVDGSFSKQLDQITREVYQQKYHDVNSNDPHTGYPCEFAIFDGKVWLGPEPDSTGYSYIMDYDTTQSDVVAGTANVPFSALNRKMLKHFTLHFLYHDLEEFELADQHKIQAEEQFDILTKREDKMVRPYSNQQYKDL